LFILTTLPVGGHFGQAEVFAEVDEVQDVFLEAGAAKAHRGLQKLGADAGVFADRVGDFVYVGAGGLAERRDRVDRRDPLGEEGVGHELRELRRPEVGRDDLLAGHPAGVNIHERRHGLLAAGRALAPHQDPIGVFEIRDGRALCQKLRIREHLELAVRRVAAQDLQERGGRADGDRALLDDDLWAFGQLGDHPGGTLDVAEVGGPAGAHAVGFRGRAHADEDDVAGADGRLDVGMEMQVAAPGRADHLVEPGLVDGQGVGVPGRDPGGVGIDDRDLDVGALGRDHRHRGAAHVAGAEAGDFHGGGFRFPNTKR
jgi:hypothetical protein